jgi:predicted O-methyltransferase YrrM
MAFLKILTKEQRNGMNVFEYAQDNNLLGQSAIKNKEFRDFFKKHKVKTVVEIGTYQGISAAYMAGFAKNIFTFDIRNYRKKYEIWQDLGVAKKIHYKTIKSRDDIKEILDTINFDTVFIDGKHTYEDVKKDYELIKLYKSKIIIFDDVAKRKGYGVRDFVKEVGANIEGNIAYMVGK